MPSLSFSNSINLCRVAFLADNFPTDTFTNEYGETFLEKFTQVASQGLGDAAQIAGWKNWEDAESDTSAILGDTISSMCKAGGDKLKDMTNKLGKKGQKMAGQMANTMKSVALGARVDFPQVWKNSAFTPSYSMTVRLYNPDPGSKTSTMRYIVGPIAALLSLCTPRVAEDESTYKWPLICKVRAEGIYNLDAAYISSVSVIKGGDQQSIAYNQALAMCDVRIDFASLYGSILSGSNSNAHGHRRPTLGTYLEAIGGKKVSAAKQTKPVTKDRRAPGLTLEEYKKREAIKNKNATTITARAEAKDQAAEAYLSGA